MSIQDVVFEVVAEVSRKDVSEVTADSALVADLGIDSQSALHLLIVLEEETRPRDRRRRGGNDGHGPRHPRLLRRAG